MCVVHEVTLPLLGAWLHHTRPSVSCGTAGHPIHGVWPHTPESFGFLLSKFLVPRIAFAAEYKVVMYTSCCKLSWCCYCDVSLCHYDVRYHGRMQSYFFCESIIQFVITKSSTMRGSIHDYWLPSALLYLRYRELNEPYNHFLMLEAKVSYPHPTTIIYLLRHCKVLV